MNKILKFNNGKGNTAVAEWFEASLQKFAIKLAGRQLPQYNDQLMRDVFKLCFKELS